MESCFYFFDKETADSISKDGRRLMEKIGLKMKKNRDMKKSEIRTMADAFVEQFRNASGIEKSYLYEGYVTGAMEILHKLGVEVTVEE